MISRRRLSKTIHGYLFILPAMLIIGVFLLYPIAHLFYISFHNWTMIGTPKYAGLQNYYDIYGDKVFRRSLYNTFLYFLMIVPPIAFLPLIVALLLNNTRVKFRSIFRSIYFLPMITSNIIISLIWLYMYHPNAGILNYLLRIIGLKPQLWLGDPRLALPCLAIMAIWASIGYYMVLYLAGLQGIPRHLIEAALIDGVNSWQMFTRMILPLIRPTMVFVIIISTIGAFQVFGEIYVMTMGGPAYATSTIVWRIWSDAFMGMKMGRAAAMAIVLFFIIAILSLLELWSMRTRYEY